jgi:DNA-binding CsgD family transcriptional regulator
VSGVLIGNFITNVHSSSISLIASVGAAVVVLIFLTLSPLLASSHYENEWAKDSAKMEIDNEQLHHFRQYRMSNREIEVCKLLLQGYTMRQISGILSIAYPTVNTYCTGIYRKTNVNSRTELLQVFKEYINSIQNQLENM